MLFVWILNENGIKNIIKLWGQGVRQRFLRFKLHGAQHESLNVSVLVPIPSIKPGKIYLSQKLSGAQRGAISHFVNLWLEGTWIFELNDAQPGSLNYNLKKCNYRAFFMLKWK